jgi:hypothetical protein
LHVNEGSLVEGDADSCHGLYYDGPLHNTGHISLSASDGQGAEYPDSDGTDSGDLYYLHDSLTPGTTYSYTATAVNLDDAGAASSNNGATTDPAPTVTITNPTGLEEIWATSPNTYTVSFTVTNADDVSDIVVTHHRGDGSSNGNGSGNGNGSSGGNGGGNGSGGVGESIIYEKSNPRIPRKKGQPAGSKKHSDLYTDENPKGTIHGLGFKDVAKAKASVSKIRNSSRSHAHKIQAAVAMEQRAREMGKTSEAAVYRKYINSMKKKTKSMKEEIKLTEFISPDLGYKGGEVIKKTTKKVKDFPKAVARVGVKGGVIGATALTGAALAKRLMKKSDDKKESSSIFFESSLPS